MNTERIEKLTKELEEKLNTHVEYRVICKLNMTDSDAFMCGEGRTKITVYFNPNWSDEFIVHHAMKVYSEADSNVMNIEEIAVNKLNDRDYILEHIERSVIGTKMNSELLEECVHREYLDLSVIYKVILDRKENERTSLTLTKEHAARMGLTIEDLDRASVKNKGIECYITVSLLKVLVESGQIPKELQHFRNDEFYPMYLISSTDGIDGAASILHTSLFSGLADVLNDDLYILPSSIHELLCVPCQGQPAYFFKEMVASVNEAKVADNEILGSNVYIYKRKTKVMKIAD